MPTNRIERSDAVKRLLILLPAFAIVVGACSSPGMTGAEYFHARDYCNGAAWGQWLELLPEGGDRYTFTYDEAVALATRCLGIVQAADERRCELEETKRIVEAAFLYDAFPDRPDVQGLYAASLAECANAQEELRLLPEERGAREDARLQMLIVLLGLLSVVLAYYLIRAHRLRRQSL